MSGLCGVQVESHECEYRMSVSFQVACSRTMSYLCQLLSKKHIDLCYLMDEFRHYLQVVSQQLKALSCEMWSVVLLDKLFKYILVGKQA